MRIKVLDHRSNGWPQDPRLRGDDKLINAAISQKSLNHEKLF
jgi:hypothetical protein